MSEKTDSDIPEILMNAPVGFFMVTPEGNYLAVNQTMARMYGYDSPVAFIGTMRDIVDQSHITPADKREFKRRLETQGNMVDYEHRVVHRNGSVRWVSSSIEAVRDKKGRILHYQGFSVDISEWKKAEATLKEKTLLLQTISDNMFDMVSLTDLEGNYKFAGASHSILGYDPGSLIGKNVLEFVHPDDLPEIATAFKSFVAERQDNRKVEYRNQCADGRYLWLETVGRFIYDENGYPKEIVFSSRDITERRGTEKEAIRERVEELEILMDVVPVAIMVAKDPQCDHMIGNRMANYIYKAPEGESVSANVNSLLRFYRDNRELKPAELPMQEAAARNMNIRNKELSFLTPNGKWRHILGSASPLRDQKGRVRGCIGAFTDITDRKLAEQALGESEERFRTMADGLPLIVWVHDEKGRQQFVNRSFLEFFGVTEAEMKEGRLKLRVHPDDEKAYADEFAASMRERSSFHAEVRVLQADGEWRWLECWGKPRLSTSGEFVGYIGTGVDITERRRAEESLQHLNATLEQRIGERTKIAEDRAKQLQSLAVELVQAEEFERQRIADLLHDDLQQLIASARMQVQSALEKRDPGPTLKNVERLLGESLEKSRRLSHELSPPVLHQFGLAAALEWLVRHVDEQFGLKVRLKAELTRQISDVPLKVFLFRAAQELLFNSVKHSGERMADVRLCDNDDTVTLTVSDLGQGFNPGILDSLDRESGFGLVSLRERAAAIGGNLDIESAPGHGSLFVLTVPISLAEVSEPEKLTRVIAGPSVKLDKQVIVSDSETIRVLFADDHKVMRQGLISMIAEQPGVQVAGEAASGEEALVLARQLRPDVIIMDVSMPGMGGVEATRRIRAEMPDIRVVGLSMLEGEDITRKMRQAGADGFVSKSESTSELLKAIYNVAGRNGRSSG